MVAYRISFDYQHTGEFILARHMNSIELQNKQARTCALTSNIFMSFLVASPNSSSGQMPCPNPNVRCNIGIAVITKNYNIIFRSDWRLDKVKHSHGESMSDMKMLLAADDGEWRAVDPGCTVPVQQNSESE